MTAIVVALFALAAVLVLVWRGVREPRRSARRSPPADAGRVSDAWRDDQERRRAADDDW